VPQRFQKRSLVLKERDQKKRCRRYESREALDSELFFLLVEKYCQVSQVDAPVIDDCRIGQLRHVRLALHR
jgi:hypothetical protein